MAIIKKLKDSNGNTVYPMTDWTSVYCGNNMTLNNKLKNYDNSLSDTVSRLSTFVDRTLPIFFRYVGGPSGTNRIYSFNSNDLQIDQLVTNKDGTICFLYIEQVPEMDPSDFTGVDGSGKLLNFSDSNYKNGDLYICKTVTNTHELYVPNLQVISKIAKEV